MILVTFIGFLIIILAVGIASVAKSTGTRADYYLASRGVSPALVGLSAVATNNSGYMFIGVIGFTYATGLAAIWLMVGWIVGDFLASLYIHGRMRTRTEKLNEATFGGMLSRWNGVEQVTLRRLAAIITVVFLGSYAAAQLAAGGKALHAVFNWEPNTGAIMVAAVVAAYCMAGGIRASIWTDAIQSIIMIVAMSILLFVAVGAAGGPAIIYQSLSDIPGYLDWFPGDLLIPGALGALLFVVGWLFAGVSVIGQPHIMVRFMALDDAKNMNTARVYYYGFFTVFYALATGVGMLSRLLLPDLGALDPELALPTMAQDLLPPALVGLILAGIFSATMSTADSLILSCSAALTHDLLPQRLENKWQIKAATLAVTLLALLIALAQPQSVFSLVILSWSALASAFAPLLIVYALGHQVPERLSLAMVVIGPAVAVLWRELGWHNSIYEGLPGILAGLAVFYIVAPMMRTPSEAKTEPALNTGR